MKPDLNSLLLAAATVGLGYLGTWADQMGAKHPQQLTVWHWVSLGAAALVVFLGHGKANAKAPGDIKPIVGGAA